MIWLIGSGPSPSRSEIDGCRDGCRTSICTFIVIEDTTSYLLCLMCLNLSGSDIISVRRPRIVHPGVIVFNPLPNVVRPHQ